MGAKALKPGTKEPTVGEAAERLHKEVPPQDKWQEWYLAEGQSWLEVQSCQRNLRRFPRKSRQLGQPRSRGFPFRLSPRCAQLAAYPLEEQVT